MSELPTFLQPHTVSVKTRTGTTGTGPVLAAAVTVKCRREDEIRLVRNRDGDQVVSSATLYTSDSRALWAPGSVVEWPGRTTVVIGVSDMDDAGMGGWQHREVTLQ